MCTFSYDTVNSRRFAVCLPTTVIFTVVNKLNGGLECGLVRFGVSDLCYGFGITAVELNYAVFTDRLNKIISNMIIGDSYIILMSLYSFVCFHVTADLNLEGSVKVSLCFNCNSINPYRINS